MQRYILFVLFLCLQWVAQGQTDYEYRYWFDKDDTNAQTGTFTPGTLHLDVDLSTLDASLHTFHIQVKNGEGEWSSPVTKYFVRKATSLTPLVYWLDNQVTPLELSSQSGHFDLDVSALDDGIHLLRLQLSQKAEGSSSPISKFFFKMPLAKQTSLLSWFDSDHQNIKKLEYNGGKPFLLDVSEIEDGFHVLYLQAMGQGGLSMPATKMFIKVPQTEGVSYLTCASFIDGKLYKTEQVSSEGGIVNWNLDVASLTQGIHNMQVQVLTPTGAATNVSNHFFFRAVTQKELSNMKLVYSLDGNEFHSATGDAANGVFHFDVDVASLEDGLHRIIYHLASDNGTSTKVSTSFFWKTPIGGNGIMEYRYWLNDNEANAQVKVLDSRVSPFSLVTLLPMESQPIRSSCFQFEVKDGVPMMYAKNDFHIAFYDASTRRVDETRQFVDYNVSQKVENISDLQSTQTFTRPEANTVKWYKFEGEKGDSVTFRSSQTMSLQLFAPSGKELYSTSADKSVNYGGCHIWEDGTYYVAAHDVTGTRPNVSLDFMHMDRYDIVAQDVHTVGNGGCSTITFQGNGFRDLYAVDLYTANGDTIHSIDIGHESDASTTATFDFTDAELGNYDALFHFAEEDKTFTNNITVEEAKDIELFTNVSFPSTFLSGSSVTYTVEITNKGNMTAYMVPLEIKLVVDDIKNVNHIKFDGYLKSLTMPQISEFDNLDSEDIEDIKHIIENSSDICQFIIYHDSVIVRDYGLSQIIMTLPPNSKQSFTVNIKSRTNVHLEAWITSNWFPLSHINSNVQKAKSLRAPSRESMCCMKDKFECGAEIVANIVGLFMPPGAGCLSSLSLTGLETAYDVWCSDGKSVSERWNNYLKSEGNSLANRLIQSAVSCVTGYYGAKLKSLREDRIMAAKLGNTTEVNRINAEIAACRTAQNSAVKNIYNGITTMILGGSCHKAWTEHKPNCPPNPGGGGGSSSPVVSYDPNDIYGYKSESGSRYISDLIQNVNYRIEVSVSTKAYCTVQNNCLPLPRFLIKGNNDNSRRTL